MSIFIYHPLNTISSKMVENLEEKMFSYPNRPQLEIMLKEKMKQAELDVYDNVYFMLGSMSSLSMHELFNKHFDIDPENQLHKIVLNNFKSKKEWAFVKVFNGRDRCVIGYCDSSPSTPFLMSSAQMAQNGVISSSFVPRA